ncbi:MAG: SdpI family protein [Flammeovirgaceae bacterium]
MKTLKNEWLVWIVMSIPFLLLFFLWNQIPDNIPTHYGFDGKPDRWNNKSTLLWFIPVLTFFIYALFWAIPKIDPKLQKESMGNKYNHIKLIVMILISSISSLFIYSSANQGIAVFSLLTSIICAFIMLLGNYLPTVKPNYFIGIRTPWTLSNEDNWLKTHRVGGRIYLIGGFVCLILNLVFPKMSVVFLITLIGILILPVFYSFYVYVTRSKQVSNP